MAEWVTHWMNGNRNTADDCRGFYSKYVLSRTDEIKTKEELSFLLGYYSHLITDAELQRTIRDPERVAAAWKRIKKVPELAEKVSGQPENLDTVKGLFRREDRMIFQKKNIPVLQSGQSVWRQRL